MTPQRTVRGTFAHRFAAVILVLVLVAAMSWLTVRAVSAGTALRDAIAERDAVVGRAGEVRIRVVRLQSMQADYLLAAIGERSLGRQADPALRAPFLAEAASLRDALTELLSGRWSQEERRFLERIYADLGTFLHADGELAGALGDPDIAEALRAARAARAAGDQAVRDLLEASAGLVAASLQPGAFHRQSLDLRERELRRMVIGAAASAAVLALVLIALWVSTARRQAVLATRLERLSLVDEPTGLPNRRAWDERLSGELARSIRLGSALSVVVVELSGRVRDLVALPAEAEMRAAAEVWKQALRRDDFIARTGRGRFAFILPVCDAVHAVAMADRMRRLVPAGCRVWAGVASWDRRESAAQLAARAQGALERIRAKEPDGGSSADDAPLEEVPVSR